MMVMVMIGGHEQVRLVFVRGRVRGRGLGGRRQPLEIELVRVSLPVHLRHYVLVVIVPANRTNTRVRRNRAQLSRRLN